MKQWVVAFGVAVVLLASLPAASADAGAPIRSEDTVLVDVNSDSHDVVTVFFRAAETSNPHGRIRALAAEAGLPVHAVKVQSVDAMFTKYSDGRAVSGGELYQTRIATEVSNRTGLLGGTVRGDALRTVAPSDSPTFVFVVAPGMTVSPGTERGHSLQAESYELSESEVAAERVSYRFGSVSLGALGVGLVGSMLGAYWLVRRQVRSIAMADATVQEQVHAIRRTASIASVATPLLPLAVASWFGAHTLVRRTAQWLLPSVPSGGWWTATVWFAALGPFVCGTWFASTLAVQPTYRDLTDVEYDLSNVLAEWGEQTVVTLFWYWLGAVVLLSAASMIVAQPLVGGVLVTLLMVARTLTMPLVFRLFGRASPISGPLRTELSELCAQTALSMPRLYLLDTGRERMANAFLTGGPGFYQMYLTEDLVEHCDRDHVRAVLAHEIGHVANRHLLKQVGFTLTFWSLAFACYVYVFQNLLTLGVATWLYFQFGTGWLSRRHEYEADAYAAALLGSEAFATALDRLASVNFMRRDTGLGYVLGSTHPSFEDRLDRLGEASVSDPNEPDDDRERTDE